MSRPIRVEEWAYARGSQARLRLRFRSRERYERVAADFDNPSGQVIRLEGTALPSEESEAAHTEVVLVGHAAESSALGTY
jgi:hypothetical protein